MAHPHQLGSVDDLEGETTGILGLTVGRVLPVATHGVALALTDEDVVEIAPTAAPGDDRSGLANHIRFAVVATPGSVQVARIVAVRTAADACGSLCGCPGRVEARVAANFDKAIAFNAQLEASGAAVAVVLPGSIDDVPLDGAGDQVKGFAIEEAFHLEVIAAPLSGINPFVVALEPAIEVDLLLIGWRSAAGSRSSSRSRAHTDHLELQSLGHIAASGGGVGVQHVVGSLNHPLPVGEGLRIEVGAFYWTVLAPEIVNPGQEEQDSVSV